MMVHKGGLDQNFIHRTATHEYSIRWTRFGNIDSPTLVFIHGTPWSSVVWHRLAASLSTYYNIYLYDHPGFGVSPPPQRLLATSDHEKVDLDASLVLRAEASAALFRHWDMSSPPHVVAHDNGGLVSLRLLLDQSIKVASMCLVDVVAIGPFGLPFFKVVAENEAVFAAIPPMFIEGLVRAYVRSATWMPMSKEIEDILSAPWLESRTQGPERFLREMVQAHHRDIGDLENQYARVGGLLPIKIIWGQNDAWLPAETAQRLKKALNAEDLAIIAEAGHLIHYDQPGTLALEVGLWLSKHSGRSK